MPNRLLFFALSAVLLFSSACALLNGTENPPSTPAPSTQTIAATLPAPLVPATATPPPETAVSFIVWIPPELIQESPEESAVLLAQISEFDINRADISITVEQKPINGEGGILSYLRAGQKVAPAILPDLIAIPSEYLTMAAEDGLIFPLDGLINSATLEDLYPAAQAMAFSQGQLVGFPFALTNLPHLAYNNSIITDTVPLTWAELISDTTHPMILPAAGSEGAKLLLQLYLAAGGTLSNEAGRPALQVAPLTAALEQISQGRNNGFILSQSSNITTLADSWQLFQTVTAVYTLTSSDQLLRQRSDNLPVGFAPIPGLNAPLVPLVDGWAWAISTTEQTHRPLAVELLLALTSPQNLGNWSLQHKTLPASRAAFAQWPDDDEYTKFMRQELELAQFTPIPSNSPILTVLENAIFNVVSLAQPTNVAAEEAVAALQP